MAARRRAALSITIAADTDAAALADLKTRVAIHLTERYGKGHWSSRATEEGALRAIAKNRVLIARTTDGIVGALSLQTKKPWAIDPRYFTAVRRALYLVGMSVDPRRHGDGIGRALIEEAMRVGRAWPADAIRLDAYDSPAGAGGFYAKCGFVEVGRVVYRTVPLIYFERVL